MKTEVSLRSGIAVVVLLVSFATGCRLLATSPPSSRVGPATPIEQPPIRLAVSPPLETIAQGGADAAGSGTLSLTVRWPNSAASQAGDYRSQLLPTSTARIAVTVKNGSTTVGSATLVRGSGEATASAAITLKVASGLDVTVKAHPATTVADGTACSQDSECGTGSACSLGQCATRTVATATASVDIVKDQTTALTVTLAPQFAPTISGFSPSPVLTGSDLTISGTNLKQAWASGNPTVAFARDGGGTVVATGAAASDGSSLTVTVPAGATTGDVTIMVDGIVSTAATLTLAPAGPVGIAAGGSHSLVLRPDGTVRASGLNGYGRLGDGTTTQRSVPVGVSGLTGILALGAGLEHSLALDSAGRVWAWGRNGSGAGQLGDGTSTDRLTPVQVSQATGLSNAIAIGAGMFHSLAIASGGAVWAWGGNGYQQLGDNTSTSRLTPVQVVQTSGLTSATAVVAGYITSLAIKTDKTVWAWGYNGNGQFGNGSTAPLVAAIPTQVPGITNAGGIATGYDFNLALKEDKTVWAWGNNDVGQLGDGTTTLRFTPIPTLTGVITISAYYKHGLALKDDGTVWAWGLNSDGQLGNNTQIDNLSPVQVMNLAGVTAISAGRDHSLAMKSDGTVWAWGSNVYGRLGDGSTTRRLTPVQVFQ